MLTTRNSITGAPARRDRAPPLLGATLVVPVAIAMLSETSEFPAPDFRQKAYAIGFAGNGRRRHGWGVTGSLPLTVTFTTGHAGDHPDHTAQRPAPVPDLRGGDARAHDPARVRRGRADRVRRRERHGPFP